MIGVSVAASRASVRRAQRQVRRAERAALTAERRVLGRAGGIVRRMEISALKGHATKAAPAVAALDKPWRTLLRPGATMGGALAQQHVWRIGRLGAHAREVDIVDGLQPLLERWEAGGLARPARLRQLVTDLQATPQGRRYYAARYARRPGWPRDPLALPAVGAMPRRDIRTPIARYADRHMPEWYAKIWQSMQRRG